LWRAQTDLSLASANLQSAIAAMGVDPPSVSG